MLNYTIRRLLMAIPTLLMISFIIFLLLDLAPNDPRLANRPGRAVAFGANETLSVMINEEDHLRLQSFAPGFARASRRSARSRRQIVPTF